MIRNASKTFEYDFKSIFVVLEKKKNYVVASNAIVALKKWSRIAAVFTKERDLFIVDFWEERFEKRVNALFGGLLGAKTVLPESQRISYAYHLQ